MKVYDIIFWTYVIIILPIASLFYFAIALTNFNAIFTFIGAAALWGAMIPYPVYKYIKIRFTVS